MLHQEEIKEIVMSFIIVSYNEAEYLRSAINSCLNQGLENGFEIIIGDDGSTDGSLEIIDEYIRRYPKLIRSFVMSRSSKAPIIASLRVSNIIRKGLNDARGRFVQIISGDDILYEGKVKLQIDFLQKNKGFVSCYTDYELFWDDGSRKEERMTYSPSRRMFWSGYYMHISCFLFRIECATNLLDRFCDDTGMIYSILKSGKIKHLRLIGFGYRQRDKSIMHTIDPIETALVEAMLLQDCCNCGYIRFISKMRFHKGMLFLFSNRKHLSEEKYEKYVMNSKEYKNDVIKVLKDYDSESFFKRFFLCFDYVIIRIISYICVIIRLFFEGTKKIIGNSKYEA